MIWIIGFIVILFVEIFSPETRRGILLVLGVMCFGGWISKMVGDGTIPAWLGGILIVLFFLSPLAVLLFPDKEKREKEEKKAYGEILNNMDRAFLRAYGKEAFILKRIREGKCFMLGPGELERARAMGPDRWFEEQDEKREAMGEDKWLEEQKKLYDDGCDYTHRV